MLRNMANCQQNQKPSDEIACRNKQLTWLNSEIQYSSVFKKKSMEDHYLYFTILAGAILAGAPSI